IFFSLKRKPHTCPHCHTVTEKVHDYRLSILKDLPIMSKKLFYIIVKDTIIVRAVINIFTNPSDYSQSTAASLHISLSIDEFRRNAGGQKFQAILTDADKHKLFGILPSRSQVSLMQYLQPVKFS
ncbi:transposase family protein, partial [Frisingicoccus sp.]|uniref:transposase family protein n=1 Tax=Frisingicoccus sp. TaxID=1918627 RepID=UPI003AB490C7